MLYICLLGWQDAIAKTLPILYLSVGISRERPAISVPKFLSGILSCIINIKYCINFSCAINKHLLNLLYVMKSLLLFLNNKVLYLQTRRLGTDKTSPMPLKVTDSIDILRSYILNVYSDHSDILKCVQSNTVQLLNILFTKSSIFFR